MLSIGHGYDVHRLTFGRKLILGGVEIPYEKGLIGHSDADVLLHAIMDALFGAAALGDIGTHFSDRDCIYKDISSMILLKQTAEILAKQGYKISNVDATILAQEPKLMNFIPSMRENISRGLNLKLEYVSVKATTEEGLGFTGSGEGIAAHAVALIES